LFTSNPIYTDTLVSLSSVIYYDHFFGIPCPLACFKEEAHMI